MIPSTREARILLDKDGLFRQLQQEARDWTWEPLQEAANLYECGTLLEHTEIALKALRALLVRDAFALSEMTLRPDTCCSYPLSHGILEQGGCRHSSLFNVQKGVVHGHTTSQDISRHQSRSDLITGSVELVNRGSTFSISLSTGESREESFGSHYLPAATTLLLINALDQGG